MPDPLEGLTPVGIIRTGADRRRIPAAFAPVLASAVDRVLASWPGATVYVYGSVATGTARPPHSDVDLLTIGVPGGAAAEIASSLTREFDERCRSVEIAASAPIDDEGSGDEPYGGRVFLHHYCVNVAGPDHDRATTGFPGDRRAARGFNGDIARHAARWNAEVDVADPTTLGRQVARKTLLAVSGLVSIHDATWTTDRRRAVDRWSAVDPGLAVGLAELLAWSSGRAAADRDRLADRLSGTVATITAQFAADIGLWDRPSEHRAE